MSATQIDILYVITDLQVGGVPLHLHRLIGSMTARGYHCAVVSLADVGPIGKRLENEGVLVRSCNARHSWDVRVLWRLTGILREVNPRIVHAMLFHANVASRWAARRAGISADRVLCEIQTVEVERRWHLVVDRWTHRGCRFTIANSPSVLDHLATQAGIPHDRLRLIRGGIDPKPFANVRPIQWEEVLGQPCGQVVLWVGRLDPIKGLDVLIKSFVRVVERVPAKLVLVGDGPLRPKLERRIQSLGLQKSIHPIGMRDDVPALMSSAHVFAFPSRTEGLPNALLEAMAAACAIVTTHVPGCRDLIVDEVNGLLVPFGDADSLSRALVRLLIDRPLASRLGQEARQDVSRNWHLTNTHEAYAAEYETIMRETK